MMSLSASYESQRREGELISYKVADVETIFKGALVCLNPEGFVVPAQVFPDWIFVGVAWEDDTQAKVRVLKTGTYLYRISEETNQTMLGQAVHVLEDDLVEIAKPNSTGVLCGYIVAIEDKTHVRIRIDNAVR